MELLSPILINHCPDDDVWCREFTATLVESGADVHYRDFRVVPPSTVWEPDITSFPVFIAVLSPAFVATNEYSLIAQAALLDMLANDDYALQPHTHHEHVMLLVVAERCHIYPAWRQAWRTYKIVSGQNDTGLFPHQAAAHVLEELTSGLRTPKHRANRADERALNLMNSGRSEEALDAIEEAITLEPDSSLYWSHKANILDKFNRVEESITAYDMAISLAPQDFLIWATKAYTLLLRERYSVALAAFEGALKLSPDNADLWAGKGDALLQMMMPSQALDAFDQALALDANDLVARWGRDRALKQLGRR